ncbi:MAG: cation-translocating P-type ATPase [Armatimonadota bacterium]|nr:cation-translocating P-type ATPase [Armatimonadota bacterium]
MRGAHTVEIPIKGMDCADCAGHVRRVIASLPGVHSVDVSLAGEKAVVRFDPSRADLPMIARAVEGAGYAVGAPVATTSHRSASVQERFHRPVLLLLGTVFGVVLFVVVVGEWLGLLEALTRRIPLPLGAAAVLAAGFPVFRNVARAAWRRQVTSHTLMTVGALAALAVGEWASAAVVVFFMRVGDYVERFTTERARRALRTLAAMAPQRARVERGGVEVEIPVEQVRPGDTVIVRPGEQIPVDGEVVGGQATVDQASITGESMPVEAGPGTRVFAATTTRLGSLRVRATHVGRDTTFGRVVTLAEQADLHRGRVQRVADRFAGYYLPVVTGIAALTLVLRRDPLAAAAVLVVACSCSFALATPIAVLASIGAAARRGLLIKGGRYLEALARADVLLIDKTGTLTLGRPRITDVVPLNGATPEEVLSLAASAERYSEHPLAEAVRSAARDRRLPLAYPEEFIAIPGQGVQARVDGHAVAVGSRRLVPPEGADGPEQTGAALEAAGKTVLYVTRDGELVGLLAAADTLRPEVPSALAAVRRLGVQQIELLTGDTEQTAAALARELDIPYRARLLPEDKITAVRAYQAGGYTVVMVGDGVNDAPALAAADVGIAMGVAGTDVAMEAAHAALLREDWTLVPELFQIARRTMGVVRTNIAFTAAYNLAGLTLAALGILPLILAAAAQSLPDLGILGNSARLLRPARRAVIAAD